MEEFLLKHVQPKVRTCVALGGKNRLAIMCKDAFNVIPLEVLSTQEAEYSWYSNSYGIIPIN